MLITVRTLSTAYAGIETSARDAFVTTDLLIIADQGTVGQADGTVRRGENPRILAGRHLLHVCFGHADPHQSDAIPPACCCCRSPCAKTLADEPESVCHAGGTCYNSSTDLANDSERSFERARLLPLLIDG